MIETSFCPFYDSLAFPVRDLGVLCFRDVEVSSISPECTTRPREKPEMPNRLQQETNANIVVISAWPTNHNHQQRRNAHPRSPSPPSNLPSIYISGSISNPNTNPNQRNTPNQLPRPHKRPPLFPSPHHLLPNFLLLISQIPRRDNSNNLLDPPARLPRHAQRLRGI